jgi:hypothetical protein
VRKLATFLAAFTLVGMTAATSLAQEGRAELRGVVTDQQGGVLPGVTVVLTDQDTGTFREVISSADGQFFAAQILTGMFTITAQLPGFNTFERIDFALRVGQTLDLDIVLTIGDLEETVTVSGQSPLVDLTSAEVGGTVNADELVQLPLVNRSAFAAIAMLPGIQFEPSASQGNDRIIANGQTGASSSLNVDGGNNADTTSGGAGGSQVKMAIESISEFQVISNQFDAEFGRATGAIINAVTKRGTNQFTGAGFTYSTGTAMTSKDFLNKKSGLDKPTNSKYEFGGILGGPIVPNKAHFFGSLERRLASPGRTRSFSSRPDLNRSSSEDWQAWNYLLRADHQINGSNSWAVRHLRELSPEKNVITGNRTMNGSQENLDDEWMIVGTYTSVIGNNLVNTARVTRGEERFNNGPPAWRNVNGSVVRTGIMRDLWPGYEHDSFWDNITPWAGGRDDFQWQFNNTTSLFVPDKAGDHDFKFGVTYHSNEISDFREDWLGGSFRFPGDQSFDFDDPTTYPDRIRVRVGQTKGLTFEYPVSALEMFFQDKWTLNDRWTLGLGLRYDAEMLNAKRFDNPLMTPGQDPRDWDNFSPRTSIAYDVTGDGRSVIRAGYGIFYDRTLFSGLDNVLQDPIMNNSFEVFFPRAENRDPGPRLGLPATDPELVGATIVVPPGDPRASDPTVCGPAQQNGCLLINHAFIDGIFPTDSTQLNEGRVYLDNERRNQPWFHQYTVGYERELAPTLSVSVDFVSMRGRDLLNRINYIAPLRSGVSPSDPLTWFDVGGSFGGQPVEGRTDTVFYAPGTFQNRVLSIESVGTSEYDALNFALEKRYANRWGARLAYAIGHSRGNSFEQYGTNGPSLNGIQSQVLGDLRLDENHQDSETDRRHILSLSGNTELPGGITASAIFRYMSELPFTVYNSTIDTNRNGSFWDPLPAGTYSAAAGSDPDVALTGVENGGRQADARSANYLQLDLRFGYRVRPQVSQTLDIYLDVINLGNRTNFNPANGNQNSGDFLNYTGLRGGGFPRQANFGVRFGF